MRGRLTLAVYCVILVFLLTTFYPLLAQESAVTHVVQPGENLYRIALRYGVSMDAIIQANDIADPRRIFSGQTLVIPGLSVPDASTEVVNPLVASTPTIHIVQPGETLGGIATQYGITVDELVRANNIANPNRILRGQALTIWTVQNVGDPAALVPDESLTATQPAAAAVPETVHVVQVGEHLAQIAQQYGVTWPVIAQMNGISDPNHIVAGQQLIIPALNAQGGVIDMGILDPGPGATVGIGKQIVVDLSDSRIYAYQDGLILRNVLVSTGLPGTPTVQGDFKVFTKLAAQTMTGPGYYLPDVPYVMYFYQGYAVHGTYWHNNFGQPMSHGCVNLPTPEARWFFDWAEVGTPVHVQA